MQENEYKVDKKQWKKWTDKERYIFNSVYFIMLNNPSLFKHPEALPVVGRHWLTTCWNAAWTAADEARTCRKANKDSS